MRRLALFLALVLLAVGSVHVAHAAKPPSFSKLQKQLKRALKAQAHEAVCDIVLQMGEIDDKKVVRTLVSVAVATEDDSVFASCKDALAIMSGDKVVGEAVKLLGKTKGPFEPRVLIAEAFARVGDKAVIEPLIASLQDPDVTVRREAAKALATKRDHRVLKALCDAYAANESNKGRLFVAIRRSLVELTGLAYATGAEWASFWTERGASFDFDKDHGAEDGGKSLVERPKFFGSEVGTTSVVFVIDVSGSMKMWDPNDEFPEEKYATGKPPQSRVRIDRAKAELIRVVKKLSDDVSFNIISFSSAPRRWQRQVLQATPANVKAAVTFVERLREGGGTETDRALEEAFKDPDIDTIFLLSDGSPEKFAEEKLDAKYRDEILRDTKKTNRFRRVRINCLGFDEPGIWPKYLGARPKSLDPQKIGQLIRFMKQLAADNGGMYQSVP